MRKFVVTAAICLFVHPALADENVFFIPKECKYSVISGFASGSPAGSQFVAELATTQSLAIGENTKNCRPYWSRAYNVAANTKPDDKSPEFIYYEKQYLAFLAPIENAILKSAGYKR